MSIYLEYQDETSAKFWQIDVNGKSHTVTYGRIGTQGVSKTKTFDDEDKCQKDADKLIKAKQAKGYAKQGQAPTLKKQTTAQKDHQAMMSELEALIKEGNPIKAFDFLHKYKNGNVTALKKALPKLRRHWLDWRELVMPSGRSRWGALGGTGQRDCLMVLMLGLFSPSDYNNQWSFVYWEIQRWLNDEMIERLVAVDCQVIPTILSTHLKDGGICDYKLLRKLEKAGLISYDPTVFVSAFVQTSGEHIIKNNEHLTRAYRNNRKNHNKNPQVYISKFANQYQYEGKTTPEPKRVIQQEAIINEVNQNHNSSKDEQLLYQGKLVPFITLNLSAFDDDPTIKSREFRHIFEFETPITNSNWLYHGNDYYNADEFANPYYQWTAHFISTGELDRQWVLNRCLEIQTNLWADNNKSYFRKLFDYLAVTDDEKIALQDGLMALLTHENKPVVNFALGYLKTIYQDERFNLVDYLGYWQSLLMNADNKTAIKTLINQATMLLKKKSFDYADDVLGAISGAFLVNDMFIQEKVAKLIVKYATPNDGINAQLAMYVPLMNADSRALLSEFLVQTDIIQADVQTYEYQPNAMSIGEELTGFDDFSEWLFALNTAIQGGEPYLFEQVMAGYLSLLCANALPDDAKKRLQSLLKSHKDVYVSSSADIFVLSWYKYAYDDTMLKPSELGHWNNGNYYKIYQTWHNLLRHFYYLIKLYEQKQLALPMLSTPTHTSSIITFDVFMDRLLAYQNAGVSIDVSDLAVAMARTKCDEGNEYCQTRLDELDNPYFKEVLACHFGLMEAPETTPPLTWRDKNGDNFIEKLRVHLKESLPANKLKCQNQFNMSTITTANWQAWRGLWAVAILTHRDDVCLVGHHDNGRIYDKVVREPLQINYKFINIMSYDYNAHKNVATGTYYVSIEIPAYLRWSTTSDLYRRQYYCYKDHYWGMIYYDVSESTVADMMFIQSLTPYRTTYIDAIITHTVLSNYGSNASGYEKLLSHITSDKYMLNIHSHLMLAHLLFHEKKQIRQMVADSMSILVTQQKLDVSAINAHILTVIHKGDLPFVRLSESVERLASYGGASADVAKLLIAHVLANITVEKLPTGFKKFVEMYYTQLIEQRQGPSDDVLTALDGLLSKSSGLKTIINKIKNL